jgi:hypothetical protein
MENSIFHENEYYQVTTNGDKTKYLLYNKITEVVEDEVTMLPTAISIAEQNNVYLVLNLWQWIRKTQEDQTKALADPLSTELLN